MRDRALEALGADRVLSARQLHAYYGVEERALRGLPFRDAEVRPVHMRASVDAKVRFYAMNKRVLERNSVSNLAHLAGTAKIRAALGILASDWTVLPGERSSNQPDAEFRSPAGLFAVEYDTGSYPALLVKDKMEAFTERYDGVVWGALSVRRRERLQQRYPDAAVIDATWWT